MNNKLLHSGNIIIAGFVAMIIFMSYLVYMCLHQKTQMVNENYYENELKYQDNINAKSNGDLYNKSYSITNENGKIKITVPTEFSSNFTNASVNFYCVSDKEFDRKITLPQSTDGEYLFDGSAWKKLSYIAKITFVVNGKSYYHELPIQL